ncbi:MAG: hypothetical protein E3K37_07965 [Candidatus Kuenenia sp.]|nr:hypothetical protein [Candidatus Kuenenia hertensis]
MKLTERTKDIIYISILFLLTLVFFEEMILQGFVSAIVFMFNGIIISRLEFLSFISTFIWIPFLLYLLDKSINTFSLYYCLLTGFVFSIQFLAGHTQTFYYSYILLCFYWFFRFIYNFFSGTKLSLSLLPILPIITITAIAIGMIQFLPTFELFNLPVRHNQFDHHMSEASLSPLHLITFFIPFYFGRPGDFSGIGLSEFWMGSFYIGISGCMLSIFAIVLSVVGHKKHRMVFLSGERNDL